jgi:nitrogen fixation protein FixH
MLVILLTFFGVVIVVNVVMARLALSTFSGEVVENSYVASQRFNGWLDKAKTERALGWKAGLVVSSDVLAVTLTDSKGQPVTGAQVSGDATHPLGANTDLALRFAETRPGVYTATLPTGRWQIHMLARAAGHEWHHLAEVTSGAGQ